MPQFIMLRLLTIWIICTAKKSSRGKPEGDYLPLVMKLNYGLFSDYGGEVEYFEAAQHKVWSSGSRRLRYVMAGNMIIYPRGLAGLISGNRSSESAESSLR